MLKEIYFWCLVFVISVINAGICPMFPHIQSLNNSLPLYLCSQQPNPGHAAAPLIAGIRESPRFYLLYPRHTYFHHL